MKSYSGFYNGHFLRSAYEYIYCKILESQNLKYKVEEITYEIEDYRYTPDFFIYDENNNLVEIVEIRGHRLNIEERIKDTNLLQEMLGQSIKVRLVTELDLRQICRDKGLSYEMLKNEWRTNPNNSINDYYGWKNPMFNKAQKESTKKLISKKAKERCNSSPDYGYNLAKSMIEYNRSVNFDFARRERSKRVTIYCLNCGRPIEVTEARAKKRKYCTSHCGVIYTSKLKKDIPLQSRVERDERLKLFVLDWCKNNKEIVLNTGFNSISSTLRELYENIENEFGIIDHRTITKAFDTSSRKEFLKILKDYVSE